MDESYDIWTFTDASISMNRCFGFKVGVYGFVHMCTDNRTNNLFPWAAGVQAIQRFDTNILEQCALYLALLDIRQLSKHQSICIITDSNMTYYRLNDAIVSYNGGSRKDWMDRNMESNAMIWNCTDLYLNLLHQGYRIDIELCKSHVDHNQQRVWFESCGRSVSSMYAENISIGNTYVDYYTRNIAANGYIPTLQQYSIGQTYLESVKAGYTRQML